MTARSVARLVPGTLALIAALSLVCPSILHAYAPPPAFTLLNGAEAQLSTPLPGMDSRLSEDRFLTIAQSEKGTGPAAGSSPEGEYGNVTEEEAGKAPAEVHVADPLEKWNRFWFKFNDKVYFWALKPAAKGYKRVVPEDFRVLFNNFYKNIASPIRIINDLLQLKLKYAGKELLRLVVNSTMGVGGLRDCADECFGIPAYNNDFGLTLGHYHVGQGFYLVWPLLGASTARDSVGIAGDYAADPLTWFVPFTVSVPMRAHYQVNYLTFHLGEYELIKRVSLDPYVAVRNAYIQNRAAALRR